MSTASRAAFPSTNSQRSFGRLSRAKPQKPQFALHALFKANWQNPGPPCSKVNRKISSLRVREGTLPVSIATPSRVRWLIPCLLVISLNCTSWPPGIGGADTRRAPVVIHRFRLLLGRLRTYSNVANYLDTRNFCITGFRPPGSRYRIPFSKIAAGSFPAPAQFHGAALLNWRLR